MLGLPALASDCPGKRLLSRIEKKPSINDEMRRDTFHTYIAPSDCSETIFSAFEGENKHLIHVGLYVDHSYARSLARFASTLGPVALGTAISRFGIRSILYGGASRVALALLRLFGLSES